MVPEDRIRVVIDPEADEEDGDANDKPWVGKPLIIVPMSSNRPAAALQHWSVASV